MIKTFIMLALVCFLATLMIMNFIIVIPKFGSKHFGAPDDIKEMMSLFFLISLILAYILTALIPR